MTRTEVVDGVAIQQVMDLAAGYLAPRCLHAVVRLGVADSLGDEPRTASDLAAAAGAHPRALFRAMRLLAAHGIFAQDGDRFAHTPASRLLRTGHPQSLAPFVKMIGHESNWRAAHHLDESLLDERAAMELVYPGGMFAYLASDPEASVTFGEAMTAKSHADLHGLLQVYDFSRFDTIADIGGGHGHVIKGILEANPGAHGVLFDLPHVIAEVPHDTPRLELVAGDFFRDRLPAADCYILMNIIHDWSDQQADTILAAVRDAAKPGATLLLVESVVPDAEGPSWAKTLDIVMLMATGGRERTAAEYKEFLAAGGFELTNVFPTPTHVYVIEARRE